MTSVVSNAGVTAVQAHVLSSSAVGSKTINTGRCQAIILGAPSKTAQDLAFRWYRTACAAEHETSTDLHGLFGEGGRKYVSQMGLNAGLLQLIDS